MPFRAVLAVLLWWLLAPCALAHARLIESVPADGAVLAARPATVALTFDGEVEPALGSLVLHGAPDVVLERVADADPRRLVAALPTLAAGAYRITWRTVSRDGHAITGVVRFVVE
ncbi:MAG: copper resistance protein CopC [Pseudomonadota bacterium]|nr:copper resistance protein CopC [Pseudomonadota bacterium]